MKLLVLASMAFFLTSCNSAKVPNVVGEEASYARGILKGQGFNVETTERVEDGVQPGQVLNQEPPAEAKSDKGSTVKLIIAKSPVYQIRGSLTLIDSEISGTDENCYGTGGYDDIQAGMPVTIRDGKGNILATGQTSNGKRPTGDFSIVQCTFEFQVNNVPKSDFYSVEAGHRGQLNYSFEEIHKKNWEVSLSIG